MIRGIRYKVPNEYGSILKEILDGIEVERYIWQINDNDAFYGGKETKSLFDDDILVGRDFADLISSEDYYVFFVKLQAFPVGSASTVLHSYEDFINSDCEFVVIIVDTIFVDIYCKNQDVTEKLRFAAVKYHFSEIEDVTDENDKNDWDNY